MKRRLLTFAIFPVLAIAGISAAALYIQNTNNTADNAYDTEQSVNKDQLAALSGFEPGADVMYHVSDSAGEITVGRDVISPDGDLNINKSGLQKLAQEAALTYNIQVNQSEQPLHVNLKINPSDGTLSVSGKGVDEFSDIVIESARNKDIVGRDQTKADWAGFFEATPAKKSSTTPDTTRLVLYDNIENDAHANKPLQIEVYQAIGGGTKDSSQVNEYENLHCESNPTEISLCDEGTTDAQNETIVSNYVIALASMTEQFSAVMLQQVAIIGSFLDAKHQMETQRELQQLQSEAVKDYHPNEQMCQFGSFVKTVAKTENTADFNKVALSNVLTSKYVNKLHSSSSEGFGLDIEARLKQFRENYCDPKDNNDGLYVMCDHNQDGDTSDGRVGAWYQNYENPLRDREDNADVGVSVPDGGVPSGYINTSAEERMNKDIDYLRTVGDPMTLGVNFTDDVLTFTEEDVVALARNLYWPRALSSASDPEGAKKNYRSVMTGRRVVAMHNVAHHSFSEIVALKSESISAEDEKNGQSFMKALMLDFGLSPEDVDDVLGRFPSYYAQMEVLTKKIYQNPDFYTNLYTKPANIDRISASLDAIDLMQARDQYDAALRREMLMSLMVEEALTKHFNLADDRIRSESRKF